jgi:hypothetical protein
MLKLPIPQLGDETLFEAILEPTASAVDKLVKRGDMGEGEINTVFGRENKVAVGVPYYENLISRLIEEKEEIPHEIKQMSDIYDFHFVSLSCSFLPDTECRFIWARFGVKLSASARSEDSRELVKEKPIAYDMFPDEVLSEIKYRREVNFGPELKFNFGVVNADMKLIDVKTRKELVIYEPQIFAYGIRRPSVAWDFKSTQEKGIWGNKRYLLLIVRAPKNSKVRGRFLLGAEVEVNIGKLIKISLTKRKDEVVNAEYDLSM